MLHVKTYVGPSTVHGLGLFASQHIPAGTVIWRFTHGVDLSFGPRRLRSICQSLDDVGMGHMRSYLYKRSNIYFLVTDDTRFINHSEGGANVAMIDDHTEIATRDISLGDEILENYFESYDLDDLFCFESRNVDSGQYLTMRSQEKRKFAKSQNISG